MGSANYVLLSCSCVYSTMIFMHNIVRLWFQLKNYIRASYDKTELDHSLAVSGVPMQFDQLSHS